MQALLLAAALITTQQRTFFTLPASNGHGAIIADTQQAKLIHFRDHLPATEEPELDLAGNPVKDGTIPRVIKTRNLLFDAYFGIRVNGTQRWLQGLTPTSSGYEDGIVTVKQTLGSLTLTTYVFTPRDLPHAGFVALLHIEGTGATGAFSLHNYHLGFGRPLPDANGETITVAPNKDVLERAFAGVVVTRPLGPVQHALGWNPTTAASGNGYTIVQSTIADYPDSSGELGVANDSASGFQFGQSDWVGIVAAHHPDPFAGATVQGWLDAYVNNRTPQQLLDAERAQWAAYQASVTLPQGLTPDEQKVARQSAVMLAMAQVKEQSTYVREWLTRDGERRYSSFAPTLPAQITHKGAGAILAGLPPAEWTYAWVRDGAYAASALAAIGREAEAQDEVRFILSAAPLPSLTRYTGFGVPEQDWNDFGPNVEYDGYGLTLWSARHAKLPFDERLQKIADALVALIDPATGLLQKDSSIWETHTMGRERTWTFTNVTAVRGLCDAAAMTADPAKADAWRKAALQLRRAIATKLTDANGALASNREELLTGTGYADAAVLDAFGFSLFKPGGRIDTATRALLEDQLKTAHGWSRNDDRTDASGLSPWGGEYDSAEWVFTDLRARTKAQRDWTTANAAANAGVIPETYDEVTGAWKFNAPMIGFGAGAYLLALNPAEDPACGQYYEDEQAAVDGGIEPPPLPIPKHCGCTQSNGLFLTLLLAVFHRSLRRHGRPTLDRPPVLEG